MYRFLRFPSWRPAYVHMMVSQVSVLAPFVVAVVTRKQLCLCERTDWFAIALVGLG
jgi:hypothetical protein